MSNDRRARWIPLTLATLAIAALLFAFWRSPAETKPGESMPQASGAAGPSHPATASPPDSHRVERETAGAAGFRVIVQSTTQMRIEGARVLVQDKRSTTDAVGTVVFDGAPDQIMVEHRDFAPSLTRVTEAMRESGQVIVTLQNGCQLRGRVTDRSGSPIAGARVSAGYGQGDMHSDSVDDTLILGAGGVAYQRFCLSAQDGTYSFSGLTPGPHLMQCSATGYVTNGRGGTAETLVAEVQNGDNIVDIQMLRLYALAIAFRNVGSGPDAALKSFGRVSFTYPAGFTDVPPGMSAVRYRAEQQIREALKAHSGSYVQVMREAPTSTERSLSVEFRASWMGVVPITGTTELIAVDKFDARIVKVVDVATSGAYGTLVVTGAFPVAIVQSDKEKPPYRTSTALEGGEAMLQVPAGRYAVVPESSFLSSKRRQDVVVEPNGVVRADMTGGEPSALLLMKVLDSSRRPAKLFSVEIVKMTGITAISSIDGTAGHALRVCCEPGKYQITLKDGAFRRVETREIEVAAGSPTDIELILTNPK
jgi:hypothetical protein